jgi:hypothetical protein
MPQGKYSGDQLDKMYSQLKSEQQELQQDWQECYKYYIPESQDLAHGVDSPNNTWDVPFDTCGMTAVNSLASGIFSHTINTSDEFFSYRIADDKVNESEEASNYMAEAGKKALKILQGSNFALESFELISNWIALNTGVQYTEMKDKVFVCKNFSIAQCCISENHNGEVDTVFREFKLTAKQAIEKFKGKVSKEIKKAASKPDTMFTKFDFIHAVFPRSERDPNKIDNTNMPYASYYYEKEKKFVNEESGYNTFPYHVPRFFHKSSSAYGRGPSFTLLSSLKELCEIRAMILDGAQMKIQPPVFLPNGSNLDDVDLSPRAINFFDSTKGKPEFYRPDIDIQSMSQYRLELKKEIEDNFFVDLFRMLEDRKNMTATEVQERISEKIQSITPVINRLYNEYFSPLLSRLYILMIENGILEEPPEIIAKSEYAVEYSTKLDNKLRALDTSQIMTAMEQVAMVKQFEMQSPDLGLVMDTDKVVRGIIKNNNVDPDYIRDESETAELREAQQQAQQNAQMMQMMSDKIAPVDMSKAPEEGSPLQDQNFEQELMG